MILYLLVALIATLLGAAAGLGGGVIIKPVLDMLGDYNIVTISVLSSVTVLCMAVVSIAKQVKEGLKITKSMVIITLGAGFGGIIGSFIFALVKSNFDPSIVTIMQSAIILVLLVLCLFYNDSPRYHIKSLVVQGLIGLFLGLLGSFLGIGGGPINVAILIILIGINLRDAVKVSVLIILFSQFSGLVVKALSGMLGQVQDVSMLLVMVPAAIAGGLIGSQLNMKLSDKSMGIVYKVAVVLVILICIYNISVLV